MKTIELPCKSLVLVDDEDYDYLNRYRWKRARDIKRSRVSRNVRMPLNYGKYYGVYLHLEVAQRAGIWSEGMEIDHRDRDPLNNLRENLRVATHKQNSHNRGIQSNNKSGYKGVSWDKTTNKWRVQLQIRGVVGYLGCYSTREEAAQVYNDAAILHYGDFAHLNVITAQPLEDHGIEPVPAA